jgi:hypothetical protein
MFISTLSNFQHRTFNIQVKMPVKTTLSDRPRTLSTLIPRRGRKGMNTEASDL